MEKYLIILGDVITNPFPNVSGDLLKQHFDKVIAESSHSLFMWMYLPIHTQFFYRKFSFQARDAYFPGWTIVMFCSQISL